MRHECTCITCGKKFVHYHDHQQACCSRKCRIEHGYKPRAKVSIAICETCGQEFEYWGTPRRFCSKECRLITGWIDSDPVKHSIFTCEWCGKEFEEWTYRQPRFCSAQCRSEFAARQPKPTTRKPEIHITRTCKWCSEEYKTTTHQVRLRNSSYCSIECRASAQGISMRGEGNPNWKGGLDPNQYGPNWNAQSRKAKKRDSHACQICGYQSGGDKILDVHHIVPFKEFDDNWKSANQLSNLICLCRPCHQQVECGRAPCPISSPSI